MLLAVDIGNTQTALGLFDGEQLVQSWRMPTDHSFTADEIHVRLHGYFHMRGLELDCVDALALAGVVRLLGRGWGGVAEGVGRGAAVMVGADTRDAVLMQNAWNGEIWFFSVDAPTLVHKRRTISLMQRSCTKPVLIVNQMPRPTKRIIST